MKDAWSLTPGPSKSSCRRWLSSSPPVLRTPSRASRRPMCALSGCSDRTPPTRRASTAVATSAEHHHHHHEQLVAFGGDLSEEGLLLTEHHRSALSPADAAADHAGATSGLKTTAEIEWWYVTDPHRGLKELQLPAWPSESLTETDASHARGRGGSRWTSGKIVSDAASGTTAALAARSDAASALFDYVADPAARCPRRSRRVCVACV